MSQSKPRTSLYPAAALIGVVGLVFVIVGASSVDAYGHRTGPTFGAILIVVVALVLVGVQLYRNTRTP
jgi:apolipoprotein N-acyltransferase